MPSTRWAPGRPEPARALLTEAVYPDGIDVDFHIVTDFQVTDFQPTVPAMDLVVQEYLEEVGMRTKIIESLSSEYFRTFRTFENPGMFYCFSNSLAEPKPSIGSGVNQEGFYAASVYPDTEIQEL